MCPARAIGPPKPTVPNHRKYPTNRVSGTGVVRCEIASSAAIKIFSKTHSSRPSQPRVSDQESDNGNRQSDTKIIPKADVQFWLGSLDHNDIGDAAGDRQISR